MAQSCIVCFSPANRRYQQEHHCSFFIVLPLVTTVQNKKSVSERVYDVPMNLGIFSVFMSQFLNAYFLFSQHKKRIRCLCYPVVALLSPASRMVTEFMKDGWPASIPTMMVIISLHVWHMIIIFRPCSDSTHSSLLPCYSILITLVLFSI